MNSSEEKLPSARNANNQRSELVFDPRHQQQSKQNPVVQKKKSKRKLSSAESTGKKENVPLEARKSKSETQIVISFENEQAVTQKEIEKQRALKKQKQLEKQRAIKKQKQLEKQRALEKQKQLEKQRAIERPRELDKQKSREEEENEKILMCRKRILDEIEFQRQMAMQLISSTDKKCDKNKKISNFSGESPTGSSVPSENVVAKVQNLKEKQMSNPVNNTSDKKNKPKRNKKERKKNQNENEKEEKLQQNEVSNVTFDCAQGSEDIFKIEDVYNKSGKTIDKFVKNLQLLGSNGKLDSDILKNNITQIIADVLNESVQHLCKKLQNLKLKSSVEMKDATCQTMLF